ncbi:MAG: APC family permease [Clostridia bacterium]|nr:APC family permease [Clostridia bacterium]
MSQKLTKKYGLLTAIAMVVGIVVGSGVFFKAEIILNATGGNLKIGILSWLIGGLIMIACAYAFAVLATRHEKVNGIVAYAESTVGDTYGYMTGWFIATIYAPCITMALAWLPARYTLVLIYGADADITGGLCMTLALFYLVATYAVSCLSPILAGKLQVAETVIKLVPLTLMAVVGTIYGLTHDNGVLIENFRTVVDPSVSPAFAVFRAVCATAFAYEGWIVATSINAELKNPKRDLPRALIIGSIVIVAIYILYYIGIAGAVPNAEMMANGQAGAKNAFAHVFGKVMGTGIFVFVIISCLGTLNGLMIGTTRNLYSLASRGRGPAPRMIGQIDEHTNMPPNSAVLGLLLCAAWLLFFYCAQLSGIGEKMGIFAFDPTELPIVTLYPLYIPIFLSMMKNEKGLKPLERFVAPALAIIGSLFMTVAAIYAHKWTTVGYMIIFSVIMSIGFAFRKVKKKA